MSDEEEDPYDDREDEVGNESAGSAAEHEDEGAEEAEEEEEPVRHLQNANAGITSGVRVGSRFHQCKSVLCQ